MCTGRVDPTMIAEAFINDADGVMVVGCHFGDCHYITGNVQGKIKVGLAERVLTYVGLSPKRISFDQCSSAEGERFVKLVTDFNQGVRELGSLGTGDGLPLSELKEKLPIAKTVLAKEKLRWVAGKFTVFAAEGNKYGEIFTEHEMWRTLDNIGAGGAAGLGCGFSSQWRYHHDSKQQTPALGAATAKRGFAEQTRTGPTCEQGLGFTF